MRVLCNRRDIEHRADVADLQAVHRHLERTAVAGDVERCLTLQQLHLAAVQPMRTRRRLSALSRTWVWSGSTQVAKFTLSGTVKLLGGHHLRNQAHAEQGDTGCGRRHHLRARWRAARGGAAGRYRTAARPGGDLPRWNLRVVRQRRLQRLAHLPVQGKGVHVGARAPASASSSPGTRGARPHPAPSRLRRNQSMASQAIVVGHGR
jgi:hypothetical protein